MGADLVGYLVVGPKRLDIQKKAEVLARVQRIFNEIRADVLAYKDLPAYDTSLSVLATDPTEVAKQEAFDTAETNLYDKIAGYFPFFVDDRDGDPGDELAEHLLAMDPAETLECLYDLWNGDGERYFRDAASRVIDDSTAVVFCGDTTWGDEPGGLGYQTLRDAEYLELFEPLGLR